jgi:DNA-binding NtrC family response regulator
MTKPVWIVDDIPAVSESITALLIANHVDAIAIYTGDEVIKRLDDGEVPSCIVTDIVMKQGNGNAVIQRIMDYPEYTFPIIIMTGDSSSISRSVIGRVSKVMMKPLDPTELLDEIKRLLGLGSN